MGGWSCQKLFLNRNDLSVLPVLAPEHPGQLAPAPSVPVPRVRMELVLSVLVLHVPVVRVGLAALLDPLALVVLVVLPALLGPVPAVRRVPACRLRQRQILALRARM